MNWTEAIGTFAAICTTFSFLPQALKVIKTKHTKDLSLLMYSVFEIGVIAWMIYGFLIGSYPVAIANVVTLVFATIILVYKIRYK
jgi:MtN3 and saliva related transmembrane protein